MAAKKLLCFQYPPFMHTEASQILFSAADLDVVWDDLPSDSDFEMMQLKLKNQQIFLHKFDIVAMVSLDERITFSKDLVLGMKSLLWESSQVHRKPILLLGVNLGLPEPHYSQQQALFDGWFIGESSSMQDMNAKVHEYFDS